MSSYMACNEHKGLAWMFYFSGSLFLIGYALFDPQGFATITKSSPKAAYLAGFIKVFFLGTSGEIIKHKITRGSLAVDRIFARAVVWGLYGLWFTAAFAGFAGGTNGLIAKSLWWQNYSFFSMSLWINILGGYAFTMMVTHEYCNFVIANNGRIWSWSRFADQVDKRFIFSYLPKTIVFFWLPAHAFTFSQPEEWRVFIAAILAVVLGFFLSIGKRRQIA